MTVARIGAPLPQASFLYIIYSTQHIIGFSDYVGGVPYNSVVSFLGFSIFELFSDVFFDEFRTKLLFLFLDFQFVELFSDGF